MRTLRALIGSAMIPALAAGIMVAPVSAQPAPEQPQSITVHPVGTTQADPNGGQWFITNLSPGESKQLQVRLYNPAEVAQTVKLYLADTIFDPQGTPEVTNEPRDIGTWGRFENATVELGPRQTIIAPFSITAPQDADPGDHIGAVVAEHTVRGVGNILTIPRVAVRLYATLPGDARRQFQVDSVTTEKDSAFFARELTVTAQLRNTGLVRLEPKVTIDEQEAKGSPLLMSYSTEKYVSTKKVPFWGGPVRMRIDAQTTSLGVPGPSQQLRVTVWVIPWHLLAMLAFAAGLAYLIRLALRRRGRKYEAMQADLRRIERLITQGATNGGGNGHGNGATNGDGHAAAHASIQAAIKQARRAGDDRTADRLEQLLHEQGSA